MVTTVGSRTGFQQINGGPYSYMPCGYQQIVGSAAAQNLSPPANATVALIAVSGASIRYRDDGIAPTAALGLPINSGQEFQYQGDLVNFEFIGAGSTLDILYYK